jgi:hypothetical protein
MPAKLGYSIIVIALLALLPVSIALAAKPAITEQEVIQAQEQWARGLVEIGQAYEKGQDYTKLAQELVGRLYAYDPGRVLFKPTKAADIPFRPTLEGAVSYFVGHNKNFPEDHGFALQPWTKVLFKNQGIIIQGQTAAAMGHYVFTPKTGSPVTVEFSFVYERQADGNLKIVLHHSSLPYTHQ